MANTKISALSNAGALGGTETVPCVQSGSTVKFSLSTLFTWLFGQTITEATITTLTVTNPMTLGTSTVDGTNLIGFRGVPQNSQSAAYTTVLTDAGKEIFHPVGDNNARTFTIDSNANVAYVVGTVIVFTNMAAANVTIAITSDTLYLAGAGTTGSRTLAQYGTAAARKITSTSWLISGTNLT